MTTEAADVELGAEISKGLLAQFVMAAIGFVGTVIFARVLGPAGFGGFYLLMLVVKVLNRPSVGWSGATKKRYSEADSRRGEILGAQVLTSAVLILASGLVVWTFRVPLQRFTGMDSVALPGFAILAAVLLFSPFQSVISATGRESRVKWIDTVRSLFTFPLQVAFVLAGFGAAGMAYGLAGATLLVLPITLSSISLTVATPTVGTLRSLWAYARYEIPNASVGMAYSQYDIFLLGVVLSPAVVGHYQVAYKLSAPATYVATVASPAIMARVSNLGADEGAIAEDVTNSLSFVSLFAVPIFFGALAIPSKIVVTIYGPEYRDAAILLVGLAFYQIVNTQKNILQETVSGLDRPDAVMRITVAALAFNVVAGVGLILLVGAPGVVLATVLAGVLQYVLFRRTVNAAVPAVTFLPRSLVNQFVAGGVMFGVVALSARFFVVASWLHLSLLVGTGAAVYFAVYGLLDSAFRTTFVSILRQLSAQVGGGA